MSELTVFDVGDRKINVENCGSCDGPHQELPILQYKRQAGHFTHWYICPTTNDPVGIALYSDQGGGAVGLKDDILLKLVEAQAAGPFLVAIWYIDAEGILQLFRMAHRFPLDNFEKCHQQLRDNLRAESGPPDGAGELLPTAKIPGLNLDKPEPETD